DYYCQLWDSSSKYVF
nr:immunoglobulin light chain junction region [Macaca mulatta]